ncbi:MAG TPA: permease-like cell division protein FtsX [Actinomycetota bacterium]|nr:permease-like cell division protein FtsX [Actinomycetota bacterium]
MRVGYFFSETVTNLKRNVLMTVAATSTVAISLLLLGGVQILGLVVNNLTLSWESKVEVSVFLRSDASSGEINALQEQLVGMDEVEDVTFVSEEQALEEFKQIYKSPVYWESLQPGDLPASLRVKLTDAKYTEAVAANVAGAPGVDDVRSGGEFVKRLLQVNSLLRTVTFMMSIILLVAAAALIANSIRLAIYARREEIGIMKLVGATNWFIRIPFMLEGLLAALVGAIVAALVVWVAHRFMFSQLSEALPFFRQVFTFSAAEIRQIVLLLSGVGAIVGLAGSGLALRRFLEV